MGWNPQSGSERYTLVEVTTPIALDGEDQNVYLIAKCFPSGRVEDLRASANGVYLDLDDGQYNRACLALLDEVERQNTP